MRPILLLGGTFDPIHHGHIQPAIEIAELLDAEQIRLIPNKIPPHKQRPDTDEHDRVKMCQLVAEDFELCEVDEIELKQERVSYSIDTLKQLRAQYPKQPLCFVMGLDSLNSLHTWHRWQDLLQYVHIVVAKRSGYKKQLHPEIKRWLHLHRSKNCDTLKSTPAGSVYLAKTSKLKISSTFIRHRLAQQLECRCLLPNKVNEYIIQQSLYQD